MHTRESAEERLAALGRDLRCGAAEGAVVDRVAGWLIWLRRRRRPWAESLRRVLIEEVARRAPRPPGAAHGPALWGRTWAVRIAAPARPGGRPRIEVW